MFGAIRIAVSFGEVGRASATSASAMRTSVRSVGHADVELEPLDSRPGTAAAGVAPDDGDEDCRHGNESGLEPRGGAEASVRPRFSPRECVRWTGPGFLMAIAYVDPGNFEVDMQAGAQFGSSLLWMLVISTAAGLLVQVLCVRLGVSTGVVSRRVVCKHARGVDGDPCINTVGTASGGVRVGLSCDASC